MYSSATPFRTPRNKTKAWYFKSKKNRDEVTSKKFLQGKIYGSDPARNHGCCSWSGSSFSLGGFRAVMPMGKFFERLLKRKGLDTTHCIHIYDRIVGNLPSDSAILRKNDLHVWFQEVKENLTKQVVTSFSRSRPTAMSSIERERGWFSLQRARRTCMK